MAIDKNMPILIVTNERILVRIFRNLLMQLGFTNIDDADSGTTALHALRSKKYDLVLATWDMEPRSGLQLAREMRAAAPLRTTPLIMILMNDRGEEMMQAREAGINAFFVKPFTVDGLKTTMVQVFGAFD